jgi:hypothetical protein
MDKINFKKHPIQLFAFVHEALTSEGATRMYNEAYKNMVVRVREVLTTRAGGQTF